MTNSKKYEKNKEEAGSVSSATYYNDVYLHVNFSDYVTIIISW